MGARERAADKKSNGNGGAPAQVEIPPDQQSTPEQPHEAPTVDLSPETVPETPPAETAPKTRSYAELFATVDRDLRRKDELERELAEIEARSAQDQHELSIEILKRAEARGLKSGGGVDIAGAMRRPKRIKSTNRYRIERVTSYVDLSASDPAQPS